MAVDYSRVRARVAAGLLCAGAGLGAITVAAPHSDHASDAIVLGCCGLAVLVAALTLRFGRWFDDWTVGTLVLAAAVTITFATAIQGLEGTSAQDNAMLYLVPVLFAACFLPLGWTVVTVLAASGSYAWLLVAQAPPVTAYARWLTTTFVIAAAAAAVRVLRTQLFGALDELARRAARDPLTGALNRRGFDERLGLELSRHGRTGEPLTVMMCDLDHFKAINDQFGHGVGDQVLQHVAAQLVAGVRTVDAVGRLGGEELAVLLPGCAVGEARVVAERLRRAIAAPVAGQPEITISIGLSDTSAAVGADDLMERADRALYEAKHAGRDCVRSATQRCDRVRGAPARVASPRAAEDQRSARAVSTSSS